MIKSYEGQTVHSAMIDAIVRQEIERQRKQWETEQRRKTENMCMELEFRRARDKKLYARLIQQANIDYPEPIPCTLIGKAFWAVAGWTILAFGALFDALGM